MAVKSSTLLFPRFVLYAVPLLNVAAAHALSPIWNKGSLAKLVVLGGFAAHFLCKSNPRIFFSVCLLQVLLLGLPIRNHLKCTLQLREFVIYPISNSALHMIEKLSEILSN